MLSSTESERSGLVKSIILKYITLTFFPENSTFTVKFTVSRRFYGELLATQLPCRYFRVKVAVNISHYNRYNV